MPFSNVGFHAADADLNYASALTLSQTCI